MVKLEKDKVCPQCGSKEKWLYAGLCKHCFEARDINEAKEKQRDEAKKYRRSYNIGF